MKRLGEKGSVAWSRLAPRGAGFATRGARGAASPGRGTLRRAGRSLSRRRRSRSGAPRDLTRLLRQPVDALEDVVDVSTRARLLGLGLELLDGCASRLVGGLQASLDLTAQIGRHPFFRLAQRSLARAH